MGPCAGGAVYSPAMTDFIIMVKNTSNMMITGPGGDQDGHARGGHAPRSWAARSRTPRSRASRTSRPRPRRSASRSSAICSRSFRRTTSKTRPSCRPRIPPDRMDPALRTLVPDNPNKPYDIKELIRAGRRRRATSSRSHPLYGKNMVVGFARFGGRSVGIVANQPAHRAGVLDIDASKKGARFVRFCDAFNLPIITFVDVPGFLPGVDQEHGGIIKHGAKLLYAFCEATVPRVTIITRKAYGGAYVVMSSKHTRADVNFAFPTAELAVMGPDGAVNIVFRNELKSADDPAAQPRRAGGRVPRELRQPVQGRRARLHRRGDPARGDAAAASSGRSRCWRRSAIRTRPRSTATSRCRSIDVQEDPDRESRRDRRARDPRLPRDRHQDGRHLLRRRSRRAARALRRRGLSLRAAARARVLPADGARRSRSRSAPAPRRSIPGYGFLAENGAFADLCRDGGHRLHRALAAT